MTPLKELAYVVYQSSNLSDWERFGVDLLGMQLAHKDADSLRLRTDQKPYRWIIEHGPAEDLVVSGYEVESGAALDELIDKISSAGFEIKEGGPALAASRGVDRMVLTTDPMGNRLELVTGSQMLTLHSSPNCC